MKRLIRILLVALLTFAPVLATAPSAFAAGSAVMSVSPASGSQVNGSNFSVNVYEDSGSQAVNATRVVLNYPSNLVDYISTTSSSAFGIEALTNGGGGTVTLDRGTTTARTGSQLIATILFKAKATGAAALNINQGQSKILTASDPPTDVLGSVQGANYTVTAPSTPPPSPSPSPSPTPSPSSPSPSPSPSNKTTPSPSPSKTTPSPSPTPSQGDKIAPTIKDISVTGVTGTTATVHWTTSEPATSEVNYGLTNGYGLTASDNNYVTDHNVVLDSKSLLPGVMFHFSVKSIDPSGNAVSSADQTFKTSGSSLAVTVLNKKKEKVHGAKVTIKDSSEVTSNDVSGETDENGQVTIKDLPTGKTTAVVQYKGKERVFNIEILPANPDGTPQSATFTIDTPSNLWIIIVLPIIVLLLLGWIVMKLRNRGQFDDDLSRHFPSVGSGVNKTQPTNNSPASTNTTQPPGSSAPQSSGPNIIRPTIPPRT